MDPIAVRSCFLPAASKYSYLAVAMWCVGFLVFNVLGTRVLAAPVVSNVTAAQTPGTREAGFPKGSGRNLHRAKESVATLQVST
jgi:hypothetical protein